MAVRLGRPGLESSCNGCGGWSADTTARAAGSRRWCHDGGVEERPEPEADAELELTPEDVVAADEAMLLDLGGAEELADLIADQSLGKTGCRPTPDSAATTEAIQPPPDDEGHAPSTN